ncbi:MAG TPA: carbamoyl-phosphate synthase large subunit [Candidatus Elarobacter sp.]|nr:carbamoyl-phosphate synthase large subunit [Candidatus Elarobacter sp.]
MHRRTIMVIGSGPIVIGQAAEFDYAGVQACRALREEGHRVVLVNSNPATIMTDPEIADAVYLEPLTVASVERIIERERPDALLPTLGGQTGLNLAVELAEAGVIEKYGVELLGTPLDTIKLAEDRERFKEKMLEIGEPVPRSQIVTEIEAGVAFANEVGYPLVVRPAYTLGGTGGGVVYDEAELRATLQTGLEASLIHQALVETSLLGWKELEYEVLRDRAGNCIIVCNMENIDPVGVHTGDSIVVAPSQTLSDLDYQMLRTASINVIRALNVQGGCNIQFALHPERSEYQIIEVNPRVSRSSALASKATGYPIAKISTKIALGQTLDQIPNPVTGGRTKAAYEPTLDYCVVKFPRWPFDKFPLADTRLGTQMKSTGEAMGIGRTFAAAMMKAVRGLDLKFETLTGGAYAEWSDDELIRTLETPTHERLFAVCELLRRGRTVEELHDVSAIDEFWLWEFKALVDDETLIRDAAAARSNGKPNDAVRDAVSRAFENGYSTRGVESLLGRPLDGISAASAHEAALERSFRMVDTAAAEFPATSPYYYLSWAESDEMRPVDREAVVVVGSGPIRIGQGIEFDYSCVHAAWALRDAGRAAVVINNNPETVSTDFDVSDVLVFEPPGADEVEATARATNARGVMLAFGGQTAINLADELAKRGITIVGSDRRSLDMAEDREKFDAALEKLGVARPRGHAANTFREARAIAREIGFPVLVRPSYVLGGRGMEIVYNEGQLASYVESAPPITPGAPLLVDKYMRGREVEVDAVFDGDDIMIPGIFEHVERAGIHSGDSISVFPTQTVSETMERRIVDVTEAIARELGIRGLINIQFVIPEGTDELLIIEANPRASRTVPIISKATGINLVAAATRIALGEKLRDMPWGTGLARKPDYVVVKVPVFSFAKMRGVETILGPEMKSTGEVLGIDGTYAGALRKGFVGAGIRLPREGGRILVSISEEEKPNSVDLLRRLAALGHTLVATPRTYDLLRANGIAAERVNRIGEGEPDVLDTIRRRSVDLVINEIGGRGQTENYRIRRAAVEASIAALTSLDTARALVTALESEAGPPRSLQEYQATHLGALAH